MMGSIDAIEDDEAAGAAAGTSEGPGGGSTAPRASGMPSNGVADVDGVGVRWSKKLGKSVGKSVMKGSRNGSNGGMP